MNNTIQAINALVALTNLIARMSSASEEISAILQRAQSEGRDLNDVELAQIHEMRRRAMERWTGGN